MANRYDDTQTCHNLIDVAIWATHNIGTYQNGALKAEEEGNEPAAALFLEVAMWERTRAETWWMELGEVGLVKNRSYSMHDGMLITSRKTTAGYLDCAISGEDFEQAEYEGFAVTARQEGFPNLALKFQLAAAEKRYNKRRFQRLLESGNIPQGRR